MQRPDLLIGLILVFVLFNFIWLTAASSQANSDGQISKQLILSLYVDESGRCLITGYIEDPGSLPFLNSSEYTYEEESRQLYAITNALTSKSADNWSVSFESPGIYEEYRIIFYLPASAKLSGVNSSQDLDYLVYAANQSVVAEVHGYDITDPAVDIRYSLQLDQAAAEKADSFPSAATGGGAGGFSLKPYLTKYIAIAFIILLLAGLGLRARTSRRRSGSGERGPCLAADEILMDPESIHRNSEHNQVGFSGSKAGSEVVRADKEVTGEISSVMATLPDKEQSIFKLLLQRGGRMAQRDLSYELDISKSSLSGILTSMEKRKLITKKGIGRTNIIELSEQFSNNKERL